MAERDGVLGYDPKTKRLEFLAETYPVRHLAQYGWKHHVTLAEGDVWRAPANEANFRQLLDLFPKTEVLETALLFREMVAAVKQQIDNIIDVEKNLKPWQVRGARWLAPKHDALLAYSPGLGKSATAIAAMRMAGVRDALLVCPLTLLGTWREEFEKWWPECQIIDWEKGKPPGITPSRPVVGLVTYDLFRRYGTAGWPFDLLLFDESVLLKTRSAQRTKAALKASRALLKKGKRVWLLTGSPTTRFYDDLYAQLQIVDPRRFTSYWRFAETYCLLKSTIWGTDVVANVPDVERRLQRDLADVFLPYSYEDLAREFPGEAIPEWVFETRQVPLPEAWWKVYKQMQDTFLAELPDGETILAPNHLVQLIRLQQIASNPELVASSLLERGEYQKWVDAEYIGGKYDALDDALQVLPQPTIVWVQFKRTADILGARLRYPILTGDTPVGERDRIRRDFQDGKLSGLVAHPGVGRFGLTLTKARSAIYVERSYDGDHYWQSLHRIRRIGTTEPPRVVHLLATGPNGERTVDFIVDRVLSFRAKSAQRLTTTQIRETLDETR